MPTEWCWPAGHWPDRPVQQAALAGCWCFLRLECELRGVAQPGSASGLGPEGREFESRRPDQLNLRVSFVKKLTRLAFWSACAEAVGPCPHHDAVSGLAERPVNGRGPSLRQTSPQRLACPAGLEPATPSLEGWCSIQLSYGQQLVLDSRWAALSAFCTGSRQRGSRAPARQPAACVAQPAPPHRASRPVWPPARRTNL